MTKIIYHTRIPFQLSSPLLAEKTSKLQKRKQNKENGNTGVRKNGDRKVICPKLFSHFVVKRYPKEFDSGVWGAVSGGSLETPAISTLYQTSYCLMRLLHWEFLKRYILPSIKVVNFLFFNASPCLLISSYQKRWIFNDYFNASNCILPRNL